MMNKTKPKRITVGVSGLEAALKEKAFIFKRDPLNVVITHAFIKDILPRQLLEGYSTMLEDDRNAKGVANRKNLTEWTAKGKGKCNTVSEYFASVVCPFFSLNWLKD